MHFMYYHISDLLAIDLNQIRSKVMTIIDLNEGNTLFLVCLSTIYSDFKASLILNHYIIAAYQL